MSRPCGWTWDIHQKGNYHEATVCPSHCRGVELGCVRVYASACVQTKVILAEKSFPKA